MIDDLTIQYLAITFIITYDVINVQIICAEFKVQEHREEPQTIQHYNFASYNNNKKTL